jgi:anti-sigma factor RsiW
MIACTDTNGFIEDLAAGDPVPEGISEHVAACPRCATRLQLAMRIERTLAERPVAVPPAAFTNTIVARIRHERWRAEQMLDLGFNVFVVCGIALIAAGVAGLVWASGLVVLSRDVFAVLEAATKSTLTTVAGQARTFLFAALLLTLALAVWWWVEQEDVTV